jgi:hypothetical protein
MYNYSLEATTDLLTCVCLNHVTGLHIQFFVCFVNCCTQRHADEHQVQLPVHHNGGTCQTTFLWHGGQSSGSGIHLPDGLFPSCIKKFRYLGTVSLPCTCSLIFSSIQLPSSTYSTPHSFLCCQTTALRPILL